MAGALVSCFLLRVERQIEYGSFGEVYNTMIYQSRTNNLIVSFIEDPRDPVSAKKSSMDTRILYRCPENATHVAFST